MNQESPGTCGAVTKYAHRNTKLWVAIGAWFAAQLSTSILLISLACAFAVCARYPRSKNSATGKISAECDHPLLRMLASK